MGIHPFLSVGQILEYWASSLVANSDCEESGCSAGDQGSILRLRRSLEGMATHSYSSQNNSWTMEPERLQSSRVLKSWTEPLTTQWAKILTETLLWVVVYYRELWGLGSRYDMCIRKPICLLPILPPKQQCDHRKGSFALGSFSLTALVAPGPSEARGFSWKVRAQ